MQKVKQSKNGFRFSVAAIAAFALVLVFALSACSADSTSNGTDGTSSGTDSTSNGTGDAGNSSTAENSAATGTTESNAGEGDGQTGASGDDLVIPVGDISETPEFFPVTVDGTRMEVFAVKASDGTVRTAFNTCQVCNGSPKAYFEQSGDTVQCQNCGNKFSMSKIGIEAGGCNPVPILDEEKTVTDESVTIPYETLQANAYRFPENWKIMA